MLEDILSQFKKRGWNTEERGDRYTFKKAEKEIVIKKEQDRSGNPLYRCDFFVSQNSDSKYFTSEENLKEYIERIIK